MLTDLSWVLKFIDKVNSIISAPDFRAYHEAPTGGVWKNKPFPDEAMDTETMLQELMEKILMIGWVPNSPRNFAYIPGSKAVTGALAEFWAHQLSMTKLTDAEGVAFQDAILDWLKPSIGFSNDSSGFFCSGSSTGALIAMQCAANHHNLWTVKRKCNIIYVTSLVHSSIAKAARIGGLPNIIFHTVESTARGTMDIEDLRRKIRIDISNGFYPFMVVAVFGTTDLGSIDPITKIAAICSTHNVWLYVDGAYGAVFLLTDELKKQFPDLAGVDSLNLDFHKGFAMPFGTGILLVKHNDALDKIVSAWTKDPCNQTTRCQRTFAAWLTIFLLGDNLVRRNLSENLQLAHYCYNMISKLPGIIMGPCPDLSIVTFRVDGQSLEDGNKKTDLLLKQTVQGGPCFINSGMFNGVVYIRVCVAGYNNVKAEVDRLIHTLAQQLGVHCAETSEMSCLLCEPRESILQLTNLMESNDDASSWCSEMFNNGEGYCAVLSTCVTWERQNIEHNPGKLPSNMKCLMRSSMEESKVEMGSWYGQGPLLPSVAKLLTSVVNCLPSVYKLCPGAAEIEYHMVSHLSSCLGMTSAAGGSVQGSVSHALICVLAAARCSVIAKNNDNGRLVIYGRASSIESVKLAALLVGLEHDTILTEVPLDSNLCMDTGELMTLIKHDMSQDDIRPFMVIGELGAMTTGTSDDLDILAKLATDYSLWLHLNIGVAGAYIFCNAESNYTKHEGMSRVDSAAVILHPYFTMGHEAPDSTVVLVRDGQALRQAMDLDLTFTRVVSEASEADYSPTLYSFELSRNARGVQFWLMTMMVGISNMKKWLLKAKQVADDIYWRMEKKYGVRAFKRPEFSILMFAKSAVAITDAAANGTPPPYHSEHMASDKPSHKLAHSMHTEHTINTNHAFTNGTSTPHSSGYINTITVFGKQMVQVNTACLNLACVDVGSICQEIMTHIGY